MKLLSSFAAENWDEAHRHREALLEYLTTVSGVGTLLDHRRYRDYDADKNVDRFLNQPEVKVCFASISNIFNRDESDRSAYRRHIDSQQQIMSRSSCYHWPLTSSFMVFLF